MSAKGDGLTFLLKGARHFLADPSGSALGAGFKTRCGEHFPACRDCLLAVWIELRRGRHKRRVYALSCSFRRAVSLSQSRRSGKKQVSVPSFRKCFLSAPHPSPPYCSPIPLLILPSHRGGDTSSVVIFRYVVYCVFYFLLSLGFYKCGLGRQDGLSYILPRDVLPDNKVWKASPMVGSRPSLTGCRFKSRVNTYRLPLSCARR